MILKRSFSLKQSKRWIIRCIFSVVIVALIAAFFVPLPYYIYSPGTAEVLSPIIDVQGGHKTEKGAFMLTTVYVVYAQNVYEFLYGLGLPFHQILPASLVNGGLSDPEYNAIEVYWMKQSHQDAEIAALRYLHEPIVVNTTGVYVVYVEPDSKALGKIRPGDVITSFDGVSVANPNTFLKLLSSAHPGQAARLGVLRGNKRFMLSVPLIGLPPISAHGSKRAGIGIVPAEAVHIQTPIKITIHSGDIDGPSAGFMFSLEIINQLYRHGDLTKGYRIAGTGTMSANGVIGQIGGVSHKVVAANAAHADIFFVPADTAAGDTNEAHAKQEAQRLHSAMRIVPVHTLAQAVAFLKSLPPKKS